MFLYEVVGICYVDKKDLYIIHVEYDRPGVKGKAVETIFVKKDYVDGTGLNVGSLIKIYRDNRAFVQGIEIV
jgi:hypothetical protein